MRTKRLFDIITAAAAVIVLAPVLCGAAVLIALRLGRPVLFRQRRGGLGGRTFEFLKFRTMTDERDADGALLPDERRVTALGRFLRASSIDELPQLWNVLRGEMSVVGPRPLLAEYLALYTGRQRIRHSVRPGITGWAQIHGRNRLSWEEKFECDVWYVENRNFWLDCWIVGLTVLRVVRGEGISSAGHATMPAFLGTPSDSEVGRTRS